MFAFSNLKSYVDWGWEIDLFWSNGDFQSWCQNVLLVFHWQFISLFSVGACAINWLQLCNISGQLISGSWDKTIKCWDPRGASGQERTLVGTYAQPERVYSMSLVGHRLVVATAGRHVNVYDLRNMSQPEQRRESSLKYQTRCVRCYPNGTGKDKILYVNLLVILVMQNFDLSFK